LGATNQGLVAGDIVNTAARFQSVALPGSVLVGEATERAAARAIVFEQAGPQQLKGKASPVPAWRAIRVVAERGGRNRTETLEAPFVGREAEFRLLKDLFHSTSGERRARLVSVVGPAGVGKSRLAWEFEKYLDGLVENVWWHQGRSPAYGEGITFWALGEMVRRRSGLLETDDQATTRSKVAEAVARNVADPDERRWIEPALLALLGVEASSTDPERLVAAWRRFFEHLAATSPVVMVFEDFHWADTGLLDFVDALLEWSRNLPIYVITLARPELLDRRPDWGAAKRNFTSVYLEPLPDAAMRELVAGLVPGLPEAAVRAMVARADGFPLYAVETVRMLIADEKVTARDDGTFSPSGDLTNLAVPGSLTALIAARLDAVDPADRSLLHGAAVLGQSFTTAALASVSGIDTADLEPRLRALVRHEFLTLEVDPRSPERGQYAFVQALIREVAYHTLAKRDRKGRHLAAARYFESLGTDELAGALAGHYLAAYRNAPDGPESAAIAGQARIALRAAAERATALGSPGQALAFLEQALTVTGDPAESAELLLSAGEAASAAGKHEAAERLLRAAVDGRRATGDRSGVARAAAALGRALLWGRSAPDALTVLEPAMTEFADDTTDPAVIALGGELARAYMLADQHQRAIEVADPVLDAAEHADLAIVVAETLVTKGSALAFLGRATEGIALIAAGQALADARGFTRTLIRAYANRAAVEGPRDPRAAVESAQAGLDVARRLGFRSLVVLLLANLAAPAIRTGEWSRALGEVDIALADEHEAADRLMLLEPVVAIGALRGEAITEQLAEMTALAGGSADPNLLANFHRGRAFAAFAAGRLSDARSAWRTAAEAWREYLPMSLASRARSALWLGDVAAARRDLAALVTSGLHGPAIEADKATIHGGVAALEGRRADALSRYREALQAWQDMGLAWDVALAGIDMATLLDPVDPEVRAAADRSRQILVRLAAKPFVERLDAAISRGVDVSSTALATQQVEAGPAALNP
jgi:tetratricopeptide (TPR) repeat protein